MKKLAFGPPLLGLALLVVGILLHSDFLGTAGVLLLALSLTGLATWRANVAQARLIVAMDDELNRLETDRQPEPSRRQPEDGA